MLRVLIGELLAVYDIISSKNKFKKCPKLGLQGAVGGDPTSVKILNAVLDGADERMATSTHFWAISSAFLSSPTHVCPWSLALVIGC